jgi:hypothetical protein
MARSLRPQSITTSVLQRANPLTMLSKRKACTPVINRSGSPDLHTREHPVGRPDGSPGLVTTGLVSEQACGRAYPLRRQSKYALI